jgi:hypothetical protein
MPRSDEEPHHRIPAVWRSGDGQVWERILLPSEPGWMFNLSGLIAGRSAAIVTGWSEKDPGRVERFQALPAVFQSEIANSTMWMEWSDSEVWVVTHSGIEVYRAPFAGPAADHNSWRTLHLRSTDGANWEPIGSPPDWSPELSIMAGPDGGFLAIGYGPDSGLGTAMAFSTDGLNWVNHPFSMPHGWTILGPHGAVATVNGEGHNLQLWSDGEVTRIRLGNLSMVPNRLQDFRGGDTHLAMLRIEGGVTSTAAAPDLYPTGDYELKVEHGNNSYLLVIDGEETLARWQLWAGVTGVFDGDDRTVTIESENGVAFTLPLDALNYAVSGPESHWDGAFDLLLSRDGITWVSDQVPYLGGGQIVGPIGHGFLVRIHQSSGNMVYTMARP